MTRKTVSERRMAGANKQIAELTQALHESREYGEVLAAGIKDKDGLIKHLKGANNRLRVKLADIDSALNASQADLHEVTAAASVTATNRDFYKEAHATLTRVVADRDSEVKDKQDKVNYLYRQYSKSREEIRDLKDGLFEVTKDARSWKRWFFALVVITAISQVVNYVVG